MFKNLQHVFDSKSEYYVKRIHTIIREIFPENFFFSNLETLVEQTLNWNQAMLRNVKNNLRLLKTCNCFTTGIIFPINN